MKLLQVTDLILMREYLLIKDNLKIEDACIFNAKHSGGNFKAKCVLHLLMISQGT